MGDRPHLSHSPQAHRSSAGRRVRRRPEPGGYSGVVEPAARKRNYEELQKRLALAARHAWVSVGPWVSGWDWELFFRENFLFDTRIFYVALEIFSFKRYNFYVSFDTSVHFAYLLC